MTKSIWSPDKDQSRTSGRGLVLPGDSNESDEQVDLFLLLQPREQEHTVFGEWPLNHVTTETQEVYDGDTGSPRLRHRKCTTDLQVKTLERAENCGLFLTR